MPMNFIGIVEAPLRPDHLGQVPDTRGYFLANDDPERSPSLPRTWFWDYALVRFTFSVSISDEISFDALA